MKKVFIITISLLMIIMFTACKKETNEGKDYYYEAKMNENMINYTLKIIDGDNLSGNLYSNDGEWLSELVNGEAIVNEIDINEFPDFKIKVNDETYIIKKK